MKQVTAYLEDARWHLLQPGDGTRYEILIAELRPCAGMGGQYQFARGNDGARRTEDVRSALDFTAGVGDGSDYILLGIVCPYSSAGMYPVSKDALRGIPERGNPRDVQVLVGYLRSPAHGFAHSDAYTVTAAVLAASVLVFDPNDVAGACRAMLRTPEVLHGHGD